ncbi:MAG: hypothetical protein VKL42_17435 [Snowella sp.]|nr:hypothetical protein [Snowella sp.]
MELIRTFLLALGPIALVFLLGGKGDAANLNATSSSCAALDSNLCDLSVGQTTRTVTVGNLQRRYILYVPPNHNNKVIMAFHGGGGDPEQFIGQTNLEPLADLKKFILIYPYGTPSLPRQPDKLLTWNAGFCCGNAVDSNIDELSFVKAIQSDISTFFSRTSPSFYGTGFSNGALLVENLAYQDPSLFKAIVSVAGTYKGTASYRPNAPLPPDPVLNSSNKINVLLIHGVKDPNIPYFGGEQQESLSSATVPIHVPTFEDGFDFWQRANQCQNLIAIGPITQEITRKSQTCNGKIVTAIVGKSMGHVWPGDPNQLEGVISPPYTDFSADDQILSFFDQNPGSPEPPQSIPEKSPLPALLILLSIFLFSQKHSK